MERVRSLGIERVALSAALGRVPAEPVVARRDQPPRDNSAMDGYAVRAADVAPGIPLPVALDVPAGAVPGVLPEGAAARIMTGAPIPAGADAVVPVEATVGPDGEGVFAARGAAVRFLTRPEPGAHIRTRGEDIRKGAVVLSAGAPCRGPHIALAAASGHALLSVHRRPRVAIVSTGDELVDLGGTSDPDRIVDGNGYGLAAEVEAAGGVPILLPIVRDDPTATREALASALDLDAVVTIGGVSAGERDHVRDALAQVGVELAFWRVALRPGGPMAFGSTPAGRLAFALPGNPVSAHVTFELFVRPALLRMGGHARCFRRIFPARLAEPVPKAPGKEYVLRAKASAGPEGWQVRLTGPQGSGILSSLVEADVLLILPRDAGDLPAGAAVDMLPLSDRMFMEAEGL